MIEEYAKYLAWREASGLKHSKENPLTYEQFVIMNFHSRDIDWRDKQWTDSRSLQWAQRSDLSFMGLSHFGLRQERK